MNEPSSSTTTIKVIVRHGTKCKRDYPGLGEDYQGCNCRKSIYIYENGKHNSFSAGTRVWDVAEKVAQAERDKRDPDKQRVKELEALLAAKEEATAAPAALPNRVKTLTIVDATERWIIIPKDIKEESVSVRRVAANRI